MKKCVLNLVNNTQLLQLSYSGNRYMAADRAANTDNFISLVSRFESLVKFSSFAVLEL